MNHAIAIDIGTSKICLVYFDLVSMEVLSTLSEANNTNVILDDTSRHEQEPLLIWEIIEKLLRCLYQSFSDLSSVQFISLTGQMHGILLIDENQKPRTNLITWRDSRPAFYSQTQSYGEKNGCIVHPGYGAHTLVALQQESLDLIRSTQLCTITSFILGRLCGIYAIDETLAASIGIFDLVKKQWNQTQIEELGLPKTVFPAVVPSCIPAGILKAELATQFGLPCTVKVFSPIGDNQASFLGSTGFIKAGVINLGTGGQLSLPCDSLAYHPSLEIRPLPSQGYLQTYSSLCGGWAYGYLKDYCKDLLKQFGVERTDSDIYQVLDSLALEKETSEGLVVDTQFLGSREKDARSGSINNLDTKNFTIANLALGFLQGMVHELHNPVMSIKSLPFIVASGNAVRKSPVVQKIIEQEFGCACKVSPFVEEAAIGSILGCIKDKQPIMDFYTENLGGNT